MTTSRLSATTVGSDVTAKTPAQRQAAHRARGRTFTVTLLDKDAIAALDRLIAKHGGVTAAVVAALKVSDKR
jgi:hypothetical protein